ncbi:uncharacterized protein [Spinacia oleracea]|uniref:DUF4283 domain-containing protein n=1 Tax=Spinacia oleracea TaxID=3562 RepID=A0ABM3RJ93_SPIOL|nr:uncharacterized protein LOC130470115 [Spinacia oleracea]
MEAFISLGREEATSLSQRWVRSLIIKVIGKSFSVEFLKSSIQRIWKLHQPLQLIALGKSFYNVSVPTEETRESILSNGPWFIAGHMLIVQPWIPGFKPSQAVISKAPVWVSLPELPIEFHTLSMLKKIANEIGSFIKTDMNAIEQNRVRFARIQVLLDLAKHRKESVWLGAFKQSIQYEEIPQFCGVCKTIGHGTERCPKRRLEREEQKMDEEETQIPTVEKTARHVEESQDTTPNDEAGNPWIHVSRKGTAEKKKKNPKGGVTEGRKKVGRTKSEKGDKGQIRKGQNKKTSGSTKNHTVLVHKVVTRLSAQLGKKDNAKAQMKQSKPQPICSENLTILNPLGSDVNTESHTPHLILPSPKPIKSPQSVPFFTVHSSLPTQPIPTTHNQPFTFSSTVKPKTTSDQNTIPFPSSSLSSPSSPNSKVTLSETPPTSKNVELPGRTNGRSWKRVGGNGPYKATAVHPEVHLQSLHPKPQVHSSLPTSPTRIPLPNHRTHRISLS